MKPVDKSSPGQQLRRLEQQRKTAAEARVRLREWQNPNAQCATGLIDQLSAAGYLPEHLNVDKEGRAGVEWSDLEGRSCSLRPYARYQWQVRIARLPHERDEAKLIQQDKFRSWRRESDLEGRRRTLAWRISAFPKSANDFRSTTIEHTEELLRFVARIVDGTQFDGCHIDADSQDAIRAAIDRINSTLHSATFSFDRCALARLQTELTTFDAHNDEQLQALLRQVGAK